MAAVAVTALAVVVAVARKLGMSSGDCCNADCGEK